VGATRRCGVVLLERKEGGRDEGREEREVGPPPTVGGARGSPRVALGMATRGRSESAVLLVPKKFPLADLLR
jgi:hypothetical protein